MFQVFQRIFLITHHILHQQIQPIVIGHIPQSGVYPQVIFKTLIRDLAVPQMQYQSPGPDAPGQFTVDPELFHGLRQLCAVLGILLPPAHGFADMFFTMNHGNMQALSHQVICHHFPVLIPGTVHHKFISVALQLFRQLLQQTVIPVIRFSDQRSGRTQNFSHIFSSFPPLIPGNSTQNLFFHM